MLKKIAKKNFFFAPGHLHRLSSENSEKKSKKSMYPDLKKKQNIMYPGTRIGRTKQNSMYRNESERKKKSYV